MRLGGYTVCWTLAMWFGGTWVAAIPTFILAVPVARGVQWVADRIRDKYVVFGG